MGDNHLTGHQVIRVAAEMIQTSGYNLLTLSNSFQDLLRRGLPLDRVVASLMQALEEPHDVLALLRPAPDIVRAFAKRIAALGATPSPPPALAVDYLKLIDHARPRHQREPSPRE
jgi:hypothetical protein